MDLPRDEHATTWEELGPGRWMTWGGLVVMRCPSCGEAAGMGDHTIRPDGVVEPSVVCTHACGFHEWIRLVGWDPTLLTPRPDRSGLAS
jgi:hypothetical protein